MSDNNHDKDPSGKQLRPQSTEERQLEEAITNANVDLNARTSTLTGEDPKLVKANPADGFRKSQVLVNDKGEEI
jgi:hypothetical protein